MNIRRTKFGLWLLAAVLTTGGLLIMAVGLSQPYDHPAASVPVAPTGQRLQRVTEFSNPKLSDFSNVWNLDLRRPLHDPPPPSQPQKEVAQLPQVKLDVQLLGYAVEDGHSLAFLMGPDRKSQLLAVGEQIGGATVRSITPQGVTLDYHGQEHLLAIEDDPPTDRHPSIPPRTTRRIDRSNNNNRRYP